MAGLFNVSADKALHLLPRVLLVGLLFFINNLRAEDILLNVNVKKPVALTSDKFLSYTLDPTFVLTGDALTQHPERSVNMARALAPAYVRIGGPRSNSYKFKKQHDHPDPDDTFSQEDWIVVHRWAEKAGVDILACIAPQHSGSGKREEGWDSRNALDLISFSDHMGFNTSWQIGYECQTRCDVSGIDIARDVMRLRSMLDAFPRYSKSVITGPDVVTYRTKHQQKYLRDYFSGAGSALSAVTWHPNFASISRDSRGVSLHHDNLASERDSLYKLEGRFISKKPLWLAESKAELCKNQFLGAVVWTRRLGNAAKLGVQVIMRQPTDSNLIQPTPDYWVSVLHKRLVGRRVLDTRVVTGNQTHVLFYCQCTKPSSTYEKGSLTIFGVNLTPSKIAVNLRGFKIKTLHKYILMPGLDTDNRMFSETVLLNNEPLNMLNERELPEIKPAISSNNKGVALKLPSGGIGFWVIPGLKIKSCERLEEDDVDKMSQKKFTTRLVGTESVEDDLNVEDEEENDIEEDSFSEDHRFSALRGKDKRKRKYKYSEEDDAEKRQKKWKISQDFEKVLKRRGSHDAYFGFDEMSQERISDESEAEEMRAKLKEYKKRLEDYENRQKGDPTLRSKISKTQDNDTIDSDRALGAFNLISKMKNAMKMLEKNDTGSSIKAFDVNTSSDVLSGLGSSNHSVNPEDRFLDELLRSEKINRTSIPQEIEERLRAMYHVLVDEKVRRTSNIQEKSKLADESKLDDALQTTNETLSRDQRDTKYDDNPLGLRKEELFRRRSTNEDLKDRRMYRRRKAEKEGRNGPVIFHPKAIDDRDKNDFYRVQQRRPLKSFRKGDVQLTASTPSQENKNGHNYVQGNDDGQEKGPRAKTISRKRTTNKSGQILQDQAPPGDQAITQSISRKSHCKEAADKQENETRFIGRETKEKTEAPSKCSTRTLVASSALRKQRPTLRNLVMALSNKGVTGLPSYSSTDYDLRSFDKATKAPLQMRAKRSNEDVERIMDQEMIFQDDNNLRDCQCRVQRGVETSKTQDSRKKLLEDRKKLREDRKERRRSQRLPHKDGSPTDGEKLQTTRAKRQASSSSAKLEELILNGQNESLEESGSESDSTNENESLLVYVESKEDAEDVVESPIGPVVEQTQKSTIKEDNEGSTEGREKEILAPVERKILKQAEANLALQRDSLVEEESATNAPPESGLENEAQDSKTYYIVKRHDADHTIRSDPRMTSESTESPTESQKMIEVGPKDMSVTEESNEESNSEADKPFLLPQTDVKATLQTVRVASEPDTASPNFGSTKFHEKLKTSSSEVKENAIGLGSIASELKTEISLTANTSAQNDVAYKKNGMTNESAVYDTTVGSVILLGDPDAPTMNIGRKEFVTDEKRKTDTEEDGSAIPTGSESSSLTTGNISILPKLTKDATRTPRKISQETELVAKALDSALPKESQLPGKLNSLPVSRKANNSKKTKKKVKKSTKKLTNQQTKLIDIQKKHAEQLRKLREKLRLKREKIVQECQDDLIVELEKAADGEERNLMKRGIINMIKNDKELQDIVDKKKLEYLMQANPVNYGETRKDDRTEHSERQKKYVPEMIEISRPLHAVREKTIEIQNQQTRHLTDPKLLAYSASENPPNSETIRKSVSESIDLTDHKIEQRSDKSYQSAVESLRNPTTYEYSSEAVSADEGSVEVSELTEPVDIRLSSVKEEDTTDGTRPILNEDSRTENEDKYKIISGSEEKRCKDMTRYNNPRRFTRNVIDNKNQYMCPKENSRKSSIENTDQLMNLFNENDQANTKPVWQGRNNDKEKHVTKKKYFKDLEYQRMYKYKSPKYERLAPKKIEVDRYLTLQNPLHYDIDYHTNEFDDIATTISKTDPNEAPSSSEYELLMPIPTKNQKKNRHRRHVESELPRDEDNSVFNEIPIDISGSPSKNREDEIVIEEVKITKKDGNEDSTETTASKVITDNEVTDESFAEVSTIIIAENSSPSTKQRSDMLDELATAAILQSVPKTVSDEESVDVHGLSDLIELAIPKVEDTLNDGLVKARHISANFEKFINEFDDEFDQKEVERDAKHPKSIEVIRMQDTAPISSNIFSQTMISTRKFFDFLTSMFHALRFN